MSTNDQLDFGLGPSADDVAVHPQHGEAAAVRYAVVHYPSDSRDRPVLHIAKTRRQAETWIRKNLRVMLFAAVTVFFAAACTPEELQEFYDDTGIDAEEFFALDLDQDGRIGLPPEPAPEPPGPAPEPAPEPPEPAELAIIDTPNRWHAIEPGSGPGAGDAQPAFYRNDQGRIVLFAAHGNGAGARTDRVFDCYKCGNKRYCVAALANHQLKVHGMPIACVQCEERTEFSTFLMLTEHRVEEHGFKDSGLPDLPCDICGKTFVIQRRLERHLFNEHAVKAVCRTCGALFSPEVLAKHEAKCDGSKPKVGQNLLTFCSDD